MVGMMPMLFALVLLSVFFLQGVLDISGIYRAENRKAHGITLLLGSSILFYISYFFNGQLAVLGFCLLSCALLVEALIVTGVKKIKGK